MTNVEYGPMNQRIGEIDVLRIDLNTNTATYYEVKGTIGTGLRKARSQINRAKHHFTQDLRGVYVHGNYGVKRI